MLSPLTIANILQTKVVSRGVTRRDQRGCSHVRNGKKEPTSTTRRTVRVRFRKQQVVGSNPIIGSSFVSKFGASRLNCSSPDTLIDTLIDLGLRKNSRSPIRSRARSLALGLRSLLTLQSLGDLTDYISTSPTHQSLD